MNCLRAEELLSDHREGQLHELLRGELDGHLRACAECRALAAALDDVLDVLRSARAHLQAPELEPAAELAQRAAVAALGAGRSARSPRAWPRVLSGRMQTLAAGFVLFAAATAVTGRTALHRRWPQRFINEAATTGVHVLERKDRALEDLRMLRVMVGATFAGRVDRVTERVDDYRRLLERRRAATPRPASSEDRPVHAPAPGAGAASPGPVSAAEPAHWAAGGGGPDSPNRSAAANVREG